MKVARLRWLLLGIGMLGWVLIWRGGGTGSVTEGFLAFDLVMVSAFLPLVFVRSWVRMRSSGVAVFVVTGAACMLWWLLSGQQPAGDFGGPDRVRIPMLHLLGVGDYRVGHVPGPVGIAGTVAAVLALLGAVAGYSIVVRVSRWTRGLGINTDWVSPGYGPHARPGRTQPPGTPRWVHPPETT